MSKKKARPRSPKRSNLPEIGLALVAIALVGAFFFLHPHATQGQSGPLGEAVPAESAAPASTSALPAQTASGSQATGSSASAWPANLPPLPVGDYTLARPVSEVRADYLFAAEHPEVEKYVPCYCGCKNMGHRNNEDCFVKERNAKGQVVKWEPHAFG